MPRRKRAKKEARQKFIHLVDPRSSDSSDDSDSLIVEPLSKNSPKNDSGIDAEGPPDVNETNEGDQPRAEDLASLASTPIPAQKTWKAPGRFSLKAWIAAKKELGIPLTGKKWSFPPYNKFGHLRTIDQLPGPVGSGLIIPQDPKRLSLTIVRPLMRVRTRG